MALRPSTVPQRVPLPSPPESSLPGLPDPESDSLRAASPTVMRVLATVVTDPSFESTAASALVPELVDFAAHCRLDYAASLVAESASLCPPSVGGDCALSTDVLEDRKEEFQCFAAAVPHLVSTLLAPEGDPDAPDIPTPRSYAEAIEGPYSSQWQAAMDTEMASWKSTGTYVDEVPPPGANIVSGMWIFRVKRPPGSPPVFKARYVARGFGQRQGVDYFQTFSPTPKMTTLRVLLHVAAQCDYELHSLDFSTAFLQGSLHKEIWLRRPPGFTGSFPPGTQWSLRRPVYGLRQAPREWHDTLRTTLAALGFAPPTADPSLFLRTNTLLPPFYILVYVDDLVFATADTAGLAHVKSELQKRHTCTDLGELRSYLGLQITRDRARRTITLTQSHMVHQVLQRFDFTYSSPQATPLSTRHSLSALPLDESVEPSGPYPELVGYLMYLMTCTRPDLAYPLSILARYVAPGRHRPEHMAAAKRVLRYLCSTSSLGLVLGGRSPVVLTGLADASWVDDLATQRSSKGYTFSLGSGSVSWRSTRLSSVLSSSSEAEIYAGAMATQELRWLTYLLTDLGEPPRSPPVLYVDNKAMLALCREHRLEHRMKHIALRYFLARELQQRGQLCLAYVASQANTADIFTKALQPCDHQRFCTMLGGAGDAAPLPLPLPPPPAAPAPPPGESSSSSSSWRSPLVNSPLGSCSRMAAAALSSGPYINRCRNLRDQFRKSGGNFPDDMFVTIILAGLSPEWRQCKSLLRTQGTLNETALCSTLLSEQKENDLYNERGNKKEKIAFYAQAPPDKKRLFCKYCKKTGHMIQDCWKLNGNNNNQKGAAAHQQGGAAARNQTVALPAVASTSQAPARLTANTSDKGKSKVLTCMVRHGPPCPNSHYRFFRKWEDMFAEPPQEWPEGSVKEEEENDPTYDELTVGQMQFDWEAPEWIQESPPARIAYDDEGCYYDYENHHDMEHHITPKLANLAKTRKEVNTWYLDSCCGQHMVSSDVFILNRERLFNEVEITVANNQTI
ncbi:unnamed protein product [Closterium sp. NIES-54]